MNLKNGQMQEEAGVRAVSERRQSRSWRTDSMRGRRGLGDCGNQGGTRWQEHRRDGPSRRAEQDWHQHAEDRNTE